MKIGDLAKATGSQAETIRYYEREGLLAEPARTDSNYRRYDATHVARLSFIRHCRSLDMTLDEIRALLRFKDDPAANCVAVNELLQCDAHGASCGILGALDRKGKSGAQPAKKAHVAGPHGRH